MKILKTLIISTLVVMFASMPAFAVDVTAEADAFKTAFLAAAAVIGATFLAAGYGAIVWKWAKGMLFS